MTSFVTEIQLARVKRLENPVFGLSASDFFAALARHDGKFNEERRASSCPCIEPDLQCGNYLLLRTDPLTRSKEI